MKFALLAGTTSKILRVFIQDSSSSTGAGLPGLVFNSSGLTAYYIREGASSPTQISLVTASVGTFTSGGFKEISSTNMPGVYELGIPNAAIATGANSVLVMLKGATNMAPCLLEIQLSEVPANLKSIDESATNGNNATLNLKQLNIVNNSGNAIVATASGGNGNGLFLTGNGVGTALRCVAGATGNGVTIVGGSTSGVGMAISTTSGIGISILASGGGGIYAQSDIGNGFHALSSSGGNGIRATGGGANSGLFAIGGATGNGVEVAGGSTSGDAIYAYAGGSGHGMRVVGTNNNDGLHATGNGSGSGIRAEGGNTGFGCVGNVGAVFQGTSETGVGLICIGNGTGAGANFTAGDNGIGVDIGGGSGVGLEITSEGSHCVEIIASGTGNGIDITTTDGHGINIESAGTGQVDINADIDVTAIAGNTTAATNLKELMLAQTSGSVATDAGNTASSFKTNLTETATDYFGNSTNGGMVLVFTSGTNIGQARPITAYDGTTKFVTVESAFDATPANSDTFVILGYAKI